MRFQRPAWWVGGLALLLRAVLSAQGQGTFQNLGFESATIVPVSGGPFVDFTQAFPGWTGYVGGVQQFLTMYDSLAMSTAGFSIIDTNYAPVYGWGSTGGLIQGRYTAVLMSGVTGPGQSSDATITQTGLVPVGTESLWFKAQFAPFSSSGSFGVTLGGQTLSLVPVASGADYTLYGADVHAFAGQTAEMAFTVFAYPQQFAADYLFLDSIQFSNQPVPEPGVFSLWALGAVLVGWRVVRRQR